MESNDWKRVGDPGVMLGKLDSPSRIHGTRHDDAFVFEQPFRRRREDAKSLVPITDEEVVEQRHDADFWRQLGMDIRAAKPSDLAPIEDHVETVAEAVRPGVFARARAFCRDVWKTMRGATPWGSA